jgi:hypothetical protein
MRSACGPRQELPLWERRPTLRLITDPLEPCVGDSRAMDVDTLATLVMLAYTPIAGALASLTILHFSKR